MQPNQNQEPDKTNLPGQTWQEGPVPAAVNQSTAAPAPVPSPAPAPVNGGVISGQMQTSAMTGNTKSPNSKRNTIIATVAVASLIFLIGMGLAAKAILDGPERTEVTAKEKPAKSDDSSSDKQPDKLSPLPAQSAESPMDAERKNEINAIHGQLEAYYARTGSYPTLADLTEPGFLAANMKGLSIATLTDPEGSEPISSTAKAHLYGYRAPKTSSCPSGRVSVCNEYELTAILSNGQTYVKKSLN